MQFETPTWIDNPQPCPCIPYQKYPIFYHIHIPIFMISIISPVKSHQIGICYRSPLSPAAAVAPKKRRNGAAHATQSRTSRSWRANRGGRRHSALDLQRLGERQRWCWLVVWNMFYIFPYIGNVIIPTDFHIFQRGIG